MYERNNNHFQIFYDSMWPNGELNITKFYFPYEI